MGIEGEYWRLVQSTSISIKPYNIVNWSKLVVTNHTILWYTGIMITEASDQLVVHNSPELQAVLENMLEVLDAVYWSLKASCI